MKSLLAVLRKLAVYLPVFVLIALYAPPAYAASGDGGGAAIFGIFILLMVLGALGKLAAFLMKILGKVLGMMVSVVLLILFLVRFLPYMQ